MANYDKVPPETKRLGNLYLFIDRIAGNKLSGDERELYRQILFSEPTFVEEWERKNQELGLRDTQELEGWFLSTMKGLIDKYIAKFLDMEGERFDTRNRPKLESYLKLPGIRQRTIEMLLFWQRGDTQGAHNRFVVLSNEFTKKNK